MQLRREVWALGDKGVSTSSPPTPIHGSRLVGASRSFTVPGSLQFQHLWGKCLVQFPSPFFPPMRWMLMWLWLAAKFAMTIGFGTGDIYVANGLTAGNLIAGSPP